ncbi:hypothetical protein ACTG9Q_11330 [Actinokineospora sp. 24-640]
MNSAGQEGSHEPVDRNQELESIRSAARWLVAAAAAMAAVIMAGLQVSAVTKIDGPASRMVVAVAAAVLGAMAAGWILVRAARVLVSPAWTLGKLTGLERTRPDHWREHPINRELQGSKSLLTTGRELVLGEIYRAQRELFVATTTLQETGSVTVSTSLSPSTSARSPIVYDANSDTDERRLRQRLDTVTEIAGRIAETANLAETRQRYHTLVRDLRIAGVLLIACLLTFVLASAPANGAPVTTPLKVELRFVPDQDALAEADLPRGCAGLSVEAIALGGTLEEPVVTSVQKPACALSQKRVPTGIATILPSIVSKP